MTTLNRDILRTQLTSIIYFTNRTNVILSHNLHLLVSMKLFADRGLLVKTLIENAHIEAYINNSFLNFDVSTCFIIIIIIIVLM